jgi:sterol desaturase/sphingolipid hydroxylase (fatty acid hydroxylase superfamily)
MKWKTRDVLIRKVGGHLFLVKLPLHGAELIKMSLSTHISHHQLLLHSRYHSPTAYSVLAMSPFELMLYDSLFVLPLFLFPIHGLVYVAELMYVYYFGLMDHSGIKMESWFPWQPGSMFHDDHHRL